jgi:uncharacterized protein
MKRVEKLFQDGQPLIAMAHLLPLPGTPEYDAAGGLGAIVEQLRVDLDVLLDAGFDAVLFCNEGDRPYSFNAGYEGVAAMTRVVTELAPKDRPFGIDFLWDSRAALAIAMATGASFIRGVMIGAYESDMGLWSTDVATLLRERRRLGADDVATFMNITPEYACSLGARSVESVASTAVVSSLADTILISGPVQGSEPDLELLARVKTRINGCVPVIANTGAKSTNVEAYLKVADGIIVGTDLKRDGHTWNHVDPERVERFMQAAGRRAVKNAVS